MDAFVARLRHQLRTPINAILGYSQLLLEEADDVHFSATERRDLERVADAGRQLLRVVNDALKPVEGGAPDIRRCLALLRDETQLTLAAAEDRVAALLRGYPDGTTGDDLRRIQSALRGFGELVETVGRESSDGVDTSGLSEAACVDSGVQAAGAVGHDAGAGTILVIDDEEGNRALLARRLTRQGHTVLTADSGESGIAMALVHPVDVILLDVMMPGLSGYDVLARLKEDAHTREMPVLMITAVAETVSVTRCITLGADDYLAKPFDPVVLAARVRACVGKKRARDFELAYLRGVATVTEAAAAVESGRFIASALDAIAARSDALGRLARLFQRMATEVAARERRLEAQVHQLTIVIDESKKAAQVHEITESDYFRDLKARAQQFSLQRAARRGRDA